MLVSCTECFWLLTRWTGNLKQQSNCLSISELSIKTQGAMKWEGRLLVYEKGEMLKEKLNMVYMSTTDHSFLSCCVFKWFFILFRQ